MAAKQPSNFWGQFKTGAIQVAFVVAVGFFLSGAQTGLNGFAPHLLPRDGAGHGRELDAWGWGAWAES